MPKIQLDENSFLDINKTKFVHFGKDYSLFLHIQKESNKLLLTFGAQNSEKAKKLLNAFKNVSPEIEQLQKEAEIATLLPIAYVFLTKEDIEKLESIFLKAQKEPKDAIKELSAMILEIATQIRKKIDLIAEGLGQKLEKKLCNTTKEEIIERFRNELTKYDPFLDPLDIEVLNAKNEIDYLYQHCVLLYHLLRQLKAINEEFGVILLNVLLK